MISRAAMYATFGWMLLLGPVTVGATTITYQMIFDVEYIHEQRMPELAVGNTYYGFFMLDDAILQSDGLNQGGDISAFHIEMEDTVWDFGLPQTPRP